VTVQFKGADEFLRRLQKAAKAGPAVAVEVARAGITVQANAMRAASPSDVAERIVVDVGSNGETATAKATLRRRPGRSSPRRPPSHYRNPKTYLSAAIRQSRSRAIAAMKRAASKTIAGK
jgi:hypothetical protein